MIDFVTVVHNSTNALAAHLIQGDLWEHIACEYTVEVVDNRLENRGFAKGCNVGAKAGTAPILGFLNPDCRIRGPFLDPVLEVFKDSTIVITGCRFGKPQEEVAGWGLKDWVCGAALFVRRRWFEEVGGFDERFVWSWEETDLCRQAQEQGYRVKSIDLPIEHDSPALTAPVIDGRLVISQDLKYKIHWLNRGKELYEEKWQEKVEVSLSRFENGAVPV